MDIQWKIKCAILSVNEKSTPGVISKSNEIKERVEIPLIHNMKSSPTQFGLRTNKFFVLFII